MKKSNSKFIQTKNRCEIISANIDNLIDERNMTPAEFQEKMWMSKQDYYKKKSVNGSSYNEEDIMKAAKVLDVTINDIYYDKEEKKSVEVLKIRKYDPIMAQQQVKIKLLNPSFERPSEILSQVIGITIVLMVIIYFISKFSAFYSLMSLFIPMFIAYDMKSSFGIEKTYIINYLDDIYYEIKDENNNKLNILQLLRVCSISIIFIPCFILTFTGVNNESISSMAIYSISTLITMVIGIVCLFIFIPKKFKKKIYQNEIKGYYASLVYLIAISITNVFATNLFSINKNYWYITMSAIISMIIASIEFAITSKKYNEYKLMYEEYNQKKRELFPKDYKF